MEGYWYTRNVPPPTPPNPNLPGWAVAVIIAAIVLPILAFAIFDIK